MTLLGGTLSRSTVRLCKPIQASILPCRSKYYNNRHRDPKYRKERARKLWKVELPNFDELREQVSLEESRKRMKEKGIAPPNVWNERELYAACTNDLIEPFKPPADEKSSSLIDKIKSPFSTGKSLFKDNREESAIRSFEGEDFDLKNFANQCTQIYVKAHEALAERDDEKMFEYVTEYCFPSMVSGLKFHTVLWKYLGDVEPPRVVQVRGGDMLSKGNKYSQITTRMYTKQILSVFDRHGRLVHGSPTDVKEVLEYIIFEKYLANEYGQWRMHGRIKANQ